MSRIGCAVTTLAKLVVHSGAADEASFDPGKLCNYMSRNAGFDSVGNIYWTKVTGLVPSFTFEGYATFKTNSAAEKAAELKSYIDKGYYLGVSVRNAGHWVAVDYVKGNTVFIMDPASTGYTNLFTSYDPNGVTQIRLFRGPNQPSNGAVDTPDQPEVEAPVYATGHYQLTANVNLRASASSSAALVTTIPNATTVNVYGVDKSWGKLTYEDKSGWISLNYASYVEPQYTYPLGRYEVTAVSGLYVRDGIGVTNRAIGMLAEKAKTEVLEAKNGWGRISYNGQTGWICLQYAVFIGDTITETPKPDAALPGDVNFNRILDDADVAMLNEFLSGVRTFSAEELALADLNGDGTISQLDVMALKLLIQTEE